MRLAAASIFLTALFLVASCNEEDQVQVKSQSEHSAQKQGDEEQKNEDYNEHDSADVIDNDNAGGETEAEPEPRTACTTTWTKPARNLKIEDIVELINTLPKPVSIACVLDTLPRPLSINATSSNLSVQPADGLTSPRIFISIDFLILTFTLSDSVVPAIEFSQIIADDRSVKGELEFPIKEDIALNEPYLQIARTGASGTRCAGCHFNEQRAPSSFPDEAYASRALRPFERQDVGLDILRTLKHSCAGKISDRCDILNALFEGETPKQYVFPKSMPTLF